MLKTMIKQGILTLVCLVILVLSGSYCLPRFEVYTPAGNRGTVVATDVYKKGYMDLKVNQDGEEVYFTWDYSGNEPGWKKGDVLLVYGDIDTTAHGLGSNVDLIVANMWTAYLMLGLALLSAVGFVVFLILFIRNWRLGALRQFSMSRLKENIITAIFGVEVIALFLSFVITGVYVVQVIMIITSPHIMTGHVVSVTREATSETYYNRTTHSQYHIYKKTIVVQLDTPYEGEELFAKTYRERYGNFVREGEPALVTFRTWEDNNGKVYTYGDLGLGVTALVFLILHKIISSIVYPKGKKVPFQLLSLKLIPSEEQENNQEIKTQTLDK
ncbi:MAG: hypothetical protein J6B50_07615 [Lachnospiraceae bacterium]|nr:hypothetical protein [Lachnospiraceae bacterium]MBP3506767.1 hypothetical protein [Lachnospiraceae bacterium]